MSAPQKNITKKSKWKPNSYVFVAPFAGDFCWQPKGKATQINLAHLQILTETTPFFTPKTLLHPLPISPRIDVFEKSTQVIGISRGRSPDSKGIHIWDLDP